MSSWAVLSNSEDVIISFSNAFKKNGVVSIYSEERKTNTHINSRDNCRCIQREEGGEGEEGRERKEGREEKEGGEGGRRRREEKEGGEG